MNRAERRRLVKEKPKKQDTLTELSEAELKIAEEELIEGAPTLKSSIFDRFAAQLGLWSQYEANRLINQEQFHLTFELPGQARDSVLQQYAKAKKGMLALERRMVETLTGTTRRHREIILHEKFQVIGGTAELPDELSARLELALQEQDHQEELTPVENHEESG